jgi:hypothetical protein
MVSVDPSAAMVKVDVPVRITFIGGKVVDVQ